LLLAKSCGIGARSAEARDIGGFVLYPGWCFEKVVMGESDGLVWLLTVAFEGTGFPRILGGTI
jgi:hypothetical protein